MASNTEVTRKWLLYTLLAFVPSLSGCSLSDFHLKGEIDATGDLVNDEVVKELDEGPEVEKPLDLN